MTRDYSRFPNEIPLGEIQGPNWLVNTIVNYLDDTHPDGIPIARDNEPNTRRRIAQRAVTWITSSGRGFPPLDTLGDPQTESGTMNVRTLHTLHKLLTLDPDNDIGVAYADQLEDQNGRLRSIEWQEIGREYTRAFYAQKE